MMVSTSRQLETDWQLAQNCMFEIAIELPMGVSGG
jgi:hypothetical protein